MFLAKIATLALCCTMVSPPGESGSAGQGAGAAPAVVPLGGDLTVNGQVVREAEIRRELVYAIGSAQLESQKLDVLIQEEIDRRVKAGEDAAKFAVSDEERTRLEKEAVDQMKSTYPDIELDAILKGNFLTKEGFYRTVSQTLRFDKVFLPDDPNAWPITTVNAIKANAGEDFITRLKETQPEREKNLADGASPEQKQGQMMFKTIMRKMVIQSLNEGSDVKTASSGLPVDVAAMVNGKAIKVDDVYAVVNTLVTPSDVARTRKWIAKVTAVEQALRQAGKYLSEDEFRAAFAEHKAPYDQSPFKLDMIATAFKRFPSMDAYMRYFRLLKSYERMIAAELDDAHLGAHLEKRANLLLGLGRVNCEFILCSAYDFPKAKWKPDGWTQAEARSVEVAKELASAGGDNWSAVLEKYSEFWDPPAPQGQVGSPAPTNTLNKGRFGLTNRNELLQKLSESEYLTFVEGSTIGDYVFFDQEAGTLGGPFRGPYGYYITRVTSRTPPQKTFSLAEPTQRDLVTQDYLAVRLAEFGQQVFEAADVKGLEPKPH